MSERKLIAYITGFVSSVALTLVAYYVVVDRAFGNGALTYVIIGLAIVQMVVQLVFFLHIGQEKGARWRLVTLSFALLIVLVIVAGSLWIMHNLDYNMMNMGPEQQKVYMHNNEGI